MIRVLIQELGDGREYIQSMQFNIKQGVYEDLGELAFLAMADTIRRNPLLIESKHRKTTEEVL